MEQEKDMLSASLLGQLVATSQKLEELVRLKLDPFDNQLTTAEMILHEVIENPRAGILHLDHKLRSFEQDFEELEEKALKRDMILIKKIKSRYKITTERLSAEEEEEFFQAYFDQLKKYFVDEDVVFFPLEEQLEEDFLELPELEESTETIVAPVDEMTEIQEEVSHDFEETRNTEEVLKEEKKEEISKPVISSLLLGQLVATVQMLEESDRAKIEMASNASSVAEKLLNDVIENPRAALCHLDEKLPYLDKSFQEIEDKGLLRDVIFLKKIKSKFSIPSSTTEQMDEPDYLAGYFQQLRKYYKGTSLQLNPLVEEPESEENSNSQADETVEEIEIHSVLEDANAGMESAAEEAVAEKLLNVETVPVETTEEPTQQEKNNEKPLISGFLLGQLVATAQLLEESTKAMTNPEDNYPTVAEVLLNEVIENPRAALLQLQHKMRTMEKHFQDIENQGILRDMILINKIKGHYRIPNEQLDKINERDYLAGYFKQLRKYFINDVLHLNPEVEEEQEEILKETVESQDDSEQLERGEPSEHLDEQESSKKLSENSQELIVKLEEMIEKSVELIEKPLISPELLGQFVATAQLLEEGVADLFPDGGNGGAVTESYFGEMLIKPQLSFSKLEELLDGISGKFYQIEQQGLVRDLKLILKIKNQYLIPSTPYCNICEEAYLNGYRKQKKKYALKPLISSGILGMFVATAQLIEEALKVSDENSLTTAENLFDEIVLNPHRALKELEFTLKKLECKFELISDQRVLRDLILIKKIRKQYRIPNRPLNQEKQDEFLKSYYKQRKKYFLEDEHFTDVSTEHTQNHETN